MRPTRDWDEIFVEADKIGYPNYNSGMSRDGAKPARTRLPTTKQWTMIQ
jgi:hypothetical protein